MNLLDSRTAATLCLSFLTVIGEKNVLELLTQIRPAPVTLLMFRKACMRKQNFMFAKKAISPVPFY